MKLTLVCLSLLSFVACGKKGSNQDNPGSTTPIVDITPGSGDSTDAGNGQGTTTGPLVGLYLGACETLGEGLALASGVQVTATHILPATAVFTSPTCASDTLSAWGHTGDFTSFQDYAAWTAAESKLAGDETTASFDELSIKFLSKAGVATSLTKVNATLTAEKRFKIVAGEPTFANGEITTNVVFNKAPLIDGLYSFGFYCENAEKKSVPQEFKIVASTSGATIVAKLNVWPEFKVPTTTRCQVTFTTLQHVSGQADVKHDVAWSQFIDVK